MTFPGSKISRLKIALLLLLASGAMVLPALRGVFLNYDDIPLLLGKSGALERSPFSFFTDLYYYAYLPFYGLSYWLDGLLFRDAPMGLHLSNVLWHAATCYAVFCVLGRLFGRAGPAALGALVFCVHPLHVESVAWIAGRKELVAGFFFFLAWLFHLGGEKGKPLSAVAAVAVFLVACFAKASAVVLPAVLAAAALLLPRYAERRKIELLRTAPLFVAALIPVGVHLYFAGTKGVLQATAPLGTRMLAFVYAWGDGLWRTLFPFGLSVDYPGAYVESAGAVVVPGLLLLAAVVAMFAARRRAPAVTFGLAAFFLCLAPFNNIFPATTILSADRYLYLSVFGAALIVAWWSIQRPRFGVAAGVVVIVFTLLSALSARRFGSDEALWTAVLDRYDGSSIAYTNRGISRVRRAETEKKAGARERLRKEAKRDFEAAFDRARLEEHKAKARSGLADANLVLQDWRGAIRAGDEALAIVKDVERDDARLFRASVLKKRGLAHEAVGNGQAALADYRESVALSSNADTWLRLGSVASALGSLPEAESAYRKAGGLDRSDPEPYVRLGLLHSALGNHAEWERMLEEASRRDPKDEMVVEAWFRFRLTGPQRDFRAATAELERLPRTSRLRKLLEAEAGVARAIYLFRRGETEEAVHAAILALDGGANQPDQLYDLGAVFLEAGRYDRAVRCFQKAGGVLGRPVYKGAVARALALKSYSLWARDLPGPAAVTMREALAIRPQSIEAGNAPLRGELLELARTERDDLVLLGLAALVGDATRGEETARLLFEEPLSTTERVLGLRLRGMLRGFSAYDLRGAQEDLRDAIGLDPADRWSRLRLAQVLGRAGSAWLRTAAVSLSVERRDLGERMLTEALEILTRLLDEDPDFHQARLERGAIYLALDSPGNQRLLDAKADFSYVSSRNAAVKEVYLKEAELHRLGFVRSGGVQKLDAAIALLEKSRRYDPNYFDAMVELGLIYALRFQRGETGQRARKYHYNLAIKWFRRAIALNPRHPAPRREYSALNLAVAREAAGAGNLKTASLLVDKALEQSPDMKEALLERALLNMQQGFPSETDRKVHEVFDETERTLDRLEELYPGDPAIGPAAALYHRRRGFAYYVEWMRRRDAARKEAARKLAVKHWRAALEASPDDEENARVRERLREIEPSQRELDADRAKAAFEAGMTALAERRWLDAAAAFREASLLIPDAPHIRLRLGYALMRAGQFEKARPEFEWVAGIPEAETQFPETFFELGLLCAHLSDDPEARAHLKTYLRIMDAKPAAEVTPAQQDQIDLARKRLEELQDE